MVVHEFSRPFLSAFSFLLHSYKKIWLMVHGFLFIVSRLALLSIRRIASAVDRFICGGHIFGSNRWLFVDDAPPREGGPLACCCSHGITDRHGFLETARRSTDRDPDRLLFRYYDHSVDIRMCQPLSGLEKVSCLPGRSFV